MQSRSIPQSTNAAPFGTQDELAERRPRRRGWRDDEYGTEDAIDTSLFGGDLSQLLRRAR